MPLMNGWEFIENYDQLDKEKRKAKVIIMLTTSLNPEAREKTEKIESITGFKTKPMSQEKFVEMMEELDFVI